MARKHRSVMNEEFAHEAIARGFAVSADAGADEERHAGPAPLGRNTRSRQTTPSPDILDQLSDREMRYRVLADYSPDWEYWLGPDGGFEYVSPACEAVCGYPAEAFLNDAGLMDRIIHKDDQPRWQGHMSRLREFSQAHDCIELRVRGVDGCWHWIEHQCQAVYDGAGRYLGQRGVNRDIGARKAAQADLKQLNRLYATLLQCNQAMVHAQGEGALLRELSHIVVQSGGLSACVISQFPEGSGALIPVAHEGLDSEWLEAMPLFGELGVAALPTSHARGVAGAYGCDDCAADTTSGQWSAWAARTGIRSCYHQAILRHDQCLGMISFMSSGQDFFTNEMIQLLTELSDDLAYVLADFRQRRRALEDQTRLARHEAHLIALLRAAPLGMGMLVGRTFTEVNPAFCHMLGYGAAELIGHGSLLIYPDEAEYTRVGDVKYAQIKSTGVGEVQTRMRRKDGREIQVHLRSAALDREQLDKGVVFTAEDISERELAAQALRESEERYRRLVDASPMSILVLQDGYFVYANGPACRDLGAADPAALKSTPALEFIHPADRPMAARRLDNIVHGKPNPATVMRLLRRDGGVIHSDSSSVPFTYDGRPAALVVGHDVSERIRAEERLRQTAKLFDSAQEGMLISDADNRILAVNRAFIEITGYQEAEVLGQTPAIFKSGRHGARFYQAMWAALKNGGQWRGEIWNRRKDGDVIPLWQTISTVSDEQGRISNYVAVFSDISQVKASLEALKRMEYHDPLTGLPNRTLFHLRLEHSIQQVQRSHKRLALVYLDLDRFKHVNDTLGHPVGDELLREVAKRMVGSLRLGDTIARLGGDEFIILMEELESPSHAATLARKLLSMAGEGIQVGDSELFISASIGISVYPDDGQDVDTLLRHAETAMYKAKDQGRNLYQFYEPRMTHGAMERLRLESALRKALERQEFVLHYQPQVGLGADRLTGVEALLRWRHPELGMIPPGQFIPLAEEIGLIGAIGDWVLEEACRQMRLWREAGFHVPRVAVNLSMPQIERGELMARVAECLRRHEMDARQLELEVTESMIMRQTERALITLQGLRDLGVWLSVDDFGTGYSSLGYLKRLPLHQLKIDKSFVNDLENDLNDAAIVRAVLALGSSLGLEVLAEGVETKAQADFLRAEGCPLAQGFLYGRPMPPEDLLERWRDR